MNLADVRVVRGEYRILRVSGEETLIPMRPSLDMIQKAIGCTCLDTVILSRKAGRPETVMLVDDTGMIDNKPVNPKATELYLAVAPKTAFHIHGDVAIVNDRDFS